MAGLAFAKGMAGLAERRDSIHGQADYTIVNDAITAPQAARQIIERLAAIPTD